RFRLQPPESYEHDEIESRTPQRCLCCRSRNFGGGSTKIPLPNPRGEPAASRSIPAARAAPGRKSATRGPSRGGGRTGAAAPRGRRVASTPRGGGAPAAREGGHRPIGSAEHPTQGSLVKTQLRRREETGSPDGRSSIA